MDENAAGAPGAPVADGKPLEVVEFAQLDTSFPVSPKDEGEVRRRYMTMLVRPRAAGARLADCEVLEATNTEGERFALKRLRPLPTDTDPFSRRGREAALFEEYRNQLAVSQLKGFPRALGYGVTREGDPAILMVWVEGDTLLEAERRGGLPQAKGGAGCTGLAVAALGLGVLSVLASTRCLDGTFVHRDLSSRNIMLLPRGGVPSEVMDLRLVDLGSSIFLSGSEATFTRTMDVWRYATPEYAPPEMLALDDRRYIEARRSPSIDVYALGSVLFEAYAGRTPFSLSERPGADAFALKAAGAPEAPRPHEPEDRPLVDAIMSCLEPEQRRRPSVTELFERIATWQGRACGRTVTLAVPPAPAPGGTSRLRSGYVSAYATPALPKAGDAAGGAGAPREGARKDLVVLSRRSLLVGAACAAGAGALGIAAWRTRLFGLASGSGLNRTSWEELASVAEEVSRTHSEDDALAVARAHGLVDADGSIADGRAKDLELLDGTRATVQLVGVYHDERADGSGRAGLTFAFAEPVSARAMSGSAMPSGGWEQCEMRSWLNADLLALLPDDLRPLVVPVSKLTNNEGATRSASSVTATQDSLWLFSMAELGGTRQAATFAAGYGYLADIIGAEGEQYRYWRDLNVSTEASSNDATQRSWDGSPCYWWTRSPSPDCSEDDGQTWFNRVGPNGDVFHFAVAATGDDEVSAVLPGFCL